MKLKLERKFLKKLEKIDRKNQTRILAKLKMLEEGKRVDLVKLAGFDNIYRLRVGNFRVKIYMDKNEAIVFDLESRGHTDSLCEAIVSDIINLI